MLNSEDNCLEHILKQISAEATTLRSLQAKLDEQKRLFTDLAVASRLKAESRTAGNYRNWPIECRLKVVPVAENSQHVLVGLKNKLHVALDGWKLLLNVRTLVLFVGHSADRESCRNKCYSSRIPFLAGGAECLHEFRIEDPFEGTAVVFDLFLLKAFDRSVFKVQISSHVIHLFDLIVGQQNTGCGSRLLLEQFRCFRYLSGRTLPLGKMPTLATCSISFGQHLVRSKRSDVMLRLCVPTLLCKLKNSNAAIDVPLNHFNAMHVQCADEPQERNVCLHIEFCGFDSNTIVDLFVEAALWRTLALLSSPAASLDETMSLDSVATEVEVSVVHSRSAD